jgi:peptidoglycan glycosyltransferase
VALNPHNGAVLVMYANPTYDDNRVQHLGAGQSIFNRATQAGYPPGSTFKVVSDTAAIDSGSYTPDSTVNGNSPVTISGVPLQNDGNKSWGPQTLTTALTNSINTIWAQVAVALGRPTMTKYRRHAYPPGSPNEDIGRIGIGQGGLQVTPLQMAMVAAAVANGGRLMVPHLATRVVDSTGRTVETIKPSVYDTVMKPQVAAQVTQMMRNVVEEGTGTPAQLNGITVAGKTGTASIGVPGSNLTEPWFIGFAPVNDPNVAVAVTIDQTRGGFGGTVAAPIAAKLIQTLVSEGR